MMILFQLYSFNGEFVVAVFHKMQWEHTTSNILDWKCSFVQDRVK